MSAETLAGKTILVTGASSGIGQDIAKHLSSLGASIIIVGRDEQRLQATLASLAGDNNRYISMDLTNESELDVLVSGLPPLNGVVFNAGAAQYDLVKFINAEKINKLFSINYTANVLLTQKLLKNKKLAKHSSLVYIASISAILGVAGTAIYASTKAALIAFAKVVASEVAVQGIRSNSISPGIVRTAMTKQSEEVSAINSMDEAEKEYALGHGKPEDLGGIVSFLLSDSARWVTGTNIVIDGGYTLK